MHAVLMRLDGGVLHPHHLLHVQTTGGDGSGKSGLSACPCHASRPMLWTPLGLAISHWWLLAQVAIPSSYQVTTRFQHSNTTSDCV